MPAAIEAVPSLDDFLRDQCEATKAKYAAELENASHAWRKPLDLWYADSLEFFGLLERLVKPLVRNGRVRGSRVWFRKTALNQIMRILVYANRDGAMNPVLVEVRQ